MNQAGNKTIHDGNPNTVSPFSSNSRDLINWMYPQQNWCHIFLSILKLSSFLLTNYFVPPQDIHKHMRVHAHVHIHISLIKSSFFLPHNVLQKVLFDKLNNLF